MSGDDRHPSLGQRLALVERAYRGHPTLPWMLAAGALAQTYRELTTLTQPALASVGLTAPRADVLQHLAGTDDGTATVTDLKTSTFLHAPTMTYNLDWLEERGLVERLPSPSDRRSILIRITDAGRAKWDAAAVALASIKYGLSSIDGDEALSIARALGRAQTSA